MDGIPGLLKKQDRYDDTPLPMTSVPAAASAPLLAIEALTCRYGDLLALDHVSMTLDAGEILGVTGAPGAGMTTLIKAIMMLVAPQDGRVLIMGNPHDLASSRSLIAHLPEDIRPPGHLAGLDFISMTSTVQAGQEGDTDMSGLAADLGFDTDLLGQPIRRYAQEDVQKLGLISVFLTDRPILLLDRPMSDLEPSARAGLRHRLKQHAAKGGGVLIGSHAIEDHQDVVDRLVMLKDGQLQKADAIEALGRTDAAA
jgi:ABC-2 type transport system ATP-binding protein